MTNYIFQLIKSALLVALIFSAPLTFAKKDAAPKDLFAEDPATHHSSSAQELVNAPEEESEEVEPAISPVDAAQRAQSRVDGQVMNVRKFKDDSKTLYGVKLLQKNGRMKTVNVDANNGNIIE
ncbi:MAG: hypothetical protein EOO68_12490 [Moraxellaceae bacterium]|nr:MAG: hypothetical protein EOO68_12490 [Moraxellaceae bacterium]